MWASQNRLRGLIGGALFMLGCAGLWDPFLSERGQNPDGILDGGGGTIDPEKQVGLCTAAGLCWQNPLPQGNRLTSVRAIASNDVWAVGAAGTILHWDGSKWSLEPSGTTVQLNDLWAYNALKLWVVGHNSTILRYTPPSFTQDPVGGLGDLYAVRGIDPQKIWAAGTNNAAVKWNGTQWQQFGPGSLVTYRGIWPQDVNNAWTCTVGGGIWAWHMQPDLLERNGGNADLLRMWGTSLSSLYAVGNSGQFLHRETGGTWTALNSGTTVTLSGMWGPDSSQAWIVGSAGTVLRWSGGTSTPTSDAGFLGVDWNDVSGVSRSDIWAVGDAGALMHRDATSWQMVRTGPTTTIHGAWAAAENDAWAVGSGGLLLHWDGTSWKSMQAPITSDWYAVAGSSGSDVWVAGLQGNAMHWNGSQWSMQPVQTTADMRGLYVAPTGTAVFAVGLTGNIYRFTGNVWQKLTSNLSTNLNAIWGSGSDDIWAAGQLGNVLHWNGSTWSPISSPTVQEIYAIGGTAVSNLWFAGANGTALYWDGVMLRSRNTGLTGNLRAVWSNGSNTLAAGENGVLFRFSSVTNTWTPQPTGTANTLRALIQRPQTATTDLWLLGDSGTILFYKS